MGSPVRTALTKYGDLLKKDTLAGTMLAAFASSCCNIAFALFNGIFGLLHRSPWHLSIFAYYILLLSIRLYLLFSDKAKIPPHTVCRKIHVLLFLMSLAMIIPSAIMVTGHRKYTHGLIPAIAMAVYTVCRITMSVHHLLRARRSKQSLVRQLRTVNLIDSLIAVLSLQNAMIFAGGGMDGTMKIFSAWSSGGILLLTMVITAVSFFRSLPPKPRKPAH